MKFFLTGIIVAMTISTTTMAQNVNIGIKGGLNGYRIENENSANTDLKLSFHAGLVGHIHLSDQWGLQPELVYSVQGSKSSFLGTDVNLNLNYLNVPLLLQYMFDNGFRVQAGPQIGMLVDAKIDIDGSEADVKDSYEDVDLGISVGASYINPSSNLGFDARYNVGLSNINANSADESYNRGFQVGLFYLFKHRN